MIYTPLAYVPIKITKYNKKTKIVTGIRSGSEGQWLISYLRADNGIKEIKNAIKALAITTKEKK